MNYPGHIIEVGEADPQVIKAIQQRLNEKGCGPLEVNGNFDSNTSDQLMVFQARFADLHGNPLKVDGIVGPVTWTALFGAETLATLVSAPNDLLTHVIDVAISQIGVMEVPPGSNNGPQVNRFQDAAGSPHGQAWCMAFVYWCIDQASVNLGRQNPAVRTGGVLDHWNRAKAPCKKILSANAIKQTSLVLPGQIFIISTGGGHGHTGLIEKVEGGLLTTIEGNTNLNGSREGIGVFRRTSRTINSINTGYLEYQ